MTKPINAMIAEELGWTTWQDPRPGKQDQWFQEKPGRAPGTIMVTVVPDYIQILKALIIAEPKQ